MRVVIAGVPRSGKTTLAKTMASARGVSLRHTDDLIGTHDWSAASQEVSGWFDSHEPWVIEGVATGRALRKWLAANPEGKPCEQVIYHRNPVMALSQGQSTMAKGCDSVWSEIEPELRSRGVDIWDKG